MKKFIAFILLCGMSLCLITGCASVAESGQIVEISDEDKSAYGAQVAETAAPTEEGYYVVEGSLLEISKDELLLETKDGQQLYFKLAPETIIYAGENKEISIGQNIKVVFDGNLTETEMEDVSVIAVALMEEDM
ncbi:MAG: hypothetical protein PUG54_07280 [Firmicutes bacterium]|nr:hypothetical protein [Bacillota bacterium]